MKIAIHTNMINTKSEIALHLLGQRQRILEIITGKNYRHQAIAQTTADTEVRSDVQVYGKGSARTAALAAENTTV